MRIAWAVFVGLMAGLPTCRADDSAVPLPEGVRAVWDLDKAVHQTTPTRERVCLNGLWQWQPAASQAEQPPATAWGWFKVPGPWPGSGSRGGTGGCQTLFVNPAWGNASNTSSAWYQRKFTVPADWSGRRIAIRAECVNSIAVVYVDGKRAGEIRWVTGETDITPFCQPGQTHTLSVLVLARPLSAMMLSAGDTFGSRQVRSSVRLRGLCGDVYLVGTPAGARMDDVKVSTSVRKWQISFETGLKNLAADTAYTLKARVSDHGQKVAEFTSKPFKAGDVKDGRFEFTDNWKPDKLWDTDTPQNMYEVQLSLVDKNGKVLDIALPERFGFRELWIEGRFFCLNGSHIFLSCVPLNNAQMNVCWASYQGARETMRRMKSYGVNFVYTHNYGCTPGTHLSFEEELRAADDEGMLMAFSQPHFNQYQWGSPEIVATNGYARDAEQYVRTAGNHPSVVFYSTSFNNAGAQEQMNPDLIDGINDVRDVGSRNNSRKAIQVEPIIHRLDPTRIIYHHSAANLGAVYTANFYANIAPMQEMSEWFGHWAKAGVKPVFLCEYGVPLMWDFAMYRGWYDGARTYGEARVPWDLCIAEWESSIYGPPAYKISDIEKEALRTEAARFKAGELWQRFDYPHNALSTPAIEGRNNILGMYLTMSFRSFRSWGLSGFCPWEHSVFWKLRDGVVHANKPLKVDWDNLQRPGFSPDVWDNRSSETVDTSYELSDWVPTDAGQALLRSSKPVLAYIGGKPGDFPNQDHIFRAGETFQKQIMMVNNSRRPVQADCQWSLALPSPISGTKSLTLPSGNDAQIPLTFALAGDTPPGRYELSLSVRLSNGDTQSDTFSIDVMAKAGLPTAGSKIALFDPKGETTKQLAAAGLKCAPVDASSDLSPYDILIVGKEALTTNNAAPDIARVRDGLKVIMFEQTSPVLEKRFGFRVEEQGLRWVFKRVSNHPLLAGISDEHLRYWRGSSTLLPHSLKYESGKMGLPIVRWCDIPVKRLWRCGNQGDVASVIIEKPARGDFMPIVDGGYSLQFSPLMEYREGRGMVLFCQMDVTGRTESDPAAERLFRNILDYVNAWKPAPARKVLYAGDPAGKRHLQLCGIAPVAYEGGPIPSDSVLVVGSGGGKALATKSASVSDFVRAGGRVLAMALDEQNANAILPCNVKMQNAEHIAAYFDTFGTDSLLAGVSPADVHNRDPRSMPLVSDGAQVFGDGVLATVPNANVVFCQIAPYDVTDEQKPLSKSMYNIRKTYRHTSFLMTRLLANLGAAGSTPILERFHYPVDKAANAAPRWSDGLYLDAPIEWDDPYRFFCW